ncbi:EAL domain-containing protein [Halothiobacillus diazotrophicus]|nr:EAL domain-containing protein [Halothiobacillus diazotrophicus]
MTIEARDNLKQDSQPAENPSAATGSCRPPRTRNRKRHQTLLFAFFALLLLPVAAGSLWIEHSQYRLAENETKDHGQHLAAAYASQIASRLNVQFTTLDFLASTLISTGTDPLHPSREADRVMRHFIELHPNIYAFNIQSADGNTIVWSTTNQSHIPINNGDEFTALGLNRNFLLGRATFAQRVDAHVLPMRFRVTDSDGKTRFFVGSPYHLDRLLHDEQPLLSRIFRFTVIDLRDRSVLGEWQDGRVLFNGTPGKVQTDPIDVPGYPLQIQINWAANRAMELYMAQAPLRWAWEIGTLFLLGLAAAGIVVLFQHRIRDAQRLKRLNEFNTMSAQVSQIIATTDDDGVLLQEICRLSIQYGHLKLAWVGTPDKRELLRCIAAFGAVDYLQDLAVSLHPQHNQQGDPVGLAWRDQKPRFYQSCKDSNYAKPWQARACRFGLHACAAHPIFRNGQIWAIFSVYHAQENVWDEDVQQLLGELAHIISRGLDQIDARNRERQLERRLLQSQNYQRALFEKNAAGLFLVDEHRIIQDANASLSEITGYPIDELVGKSTALLHVDHDAFERFATQHAALLHGQPWIHETANIRRKDGTIIIVQILGSPVSLASGDPGILWSIVDVTLQQQAQDQILFESLHDALTRLPNRRALDEYLPKAIARADRQNTILAVGMLDLDDFKPINDNWGHEAGDKLLNQLAARMQSLIRETDFLVRLGGDEFIVVLENLESGNTMAQLQAALDRLHQAVEYPFVLSETTRAEVGMTLGVALFPFDAKDGDSLIRHADAAMYQAKEHKHDRQQWWRHGVDRAGPPESEKQFDAYSEEAVALLHKTRPYLERVLGQFVNSFYSELARDPQANAILKTLSNQEMAGLMQSQRHHLQFLLNPETSQAGLIEHARHVGTVHVLVGVRPILLTQGISLYRRLLNEHLSHALLPARERYRLLITAETRIQDDLHVELAIEDQILTAYFRLNSAPLPPQGISWQESSTAEINQIGALAGIQAALLVQLAPDGTFTIVTHAGPLASTVAELYARPGHEPVVDPSSPRGMTICAQAWRSRQIYSIPSLSQDPHYQVWRESPLIERARSALSVPIINEQGQCEAVIVMMGAYPSQFESQVMQQFAFGMKQRWEQIWARSGTRPPIVPEAEAKKIRQRLFNNGLQMLVQPIVDLRTGQMIKVEALARLNLKEAQTVPPSFFLALLSEAELNRLFCIGLEASLAHLVSWDEQGMSVDVSINLPPCALLDNQSPDWVRTALEKYGIAPQRLTLELLETQSMDIVQRNEVIERLLNLGVKLAIDDLGSGYSSLQRLSSIPFETIKIDQGLLIQVRDKPIQTIGLISSIVQMGRDLNFVVVVEGLEDKGMLEMAAILGAQQGQGYALARPMTAKHLEPWYRGFELPIRPEKIDTFLGALTYHWWFIHHEHHVHPVDEAECPLTQFLIDQDLQDSEVARWHKLIHDNPGDAGTSALLTGYLIERIRDKSI